MDEISPPDAAPPNAGLFARQAERWRRLPGNVRGTLWALAGGGFFAIMMTLIKLVGMTLHVTEVLLFRQFFMILLAMPVIVRVGFAEAFLTERPWWQAARVLVAVGAMLFGFTAVIHLPLADAITIGFARTFFISIFAILFLSEVVGIRRWSAMVVGFAGVLIVAQPEGVGSFNIYGLLAIFGAACAGMVMVIIRILTRTDRPVTILSYQAIGIGLIMIPPAIYYWRAPTWTELAILLAIGAVSSISQTCSILAFRAGEASAVAALDYVRLVYAVLLGVLVFSQWPTPRVLVGAVIIVGAGVYTIVRERRAALEKRAQAAHGGGGLGGPI